MEEIDFEKLKQRLEVLERADYPDKIARLQQRLKTMEGACKWSVPITVLLIVLAMWFGEAWLRAKHYEYLNAKEVNAESVRVSDNFDKTVVHIDGGVLTVGSIEGEMSLGISEGGPYLYLDDQKGHSASLQLRSNKLTIVRSDENGDEVLKPLE